MVTDSELLVLADNVWYSLCDRDGGFAYSEVFMHLEYIVGQPADDIERRLEEIDAVIVSPP